MPCTFRPDIMIARLKEKGLTRASLEGLPKPLNLPAGVTVHLRNSGILAKIGNYRKPGHGGLVNIYGPGPKYSALMDWWH